MAPMVIAPLPSLFRPSPDPPPYVYPQALSHVAPPEPPDPPGDLPYLTMATKLCDGGVHFVFPVVCRSSPCRLVEGSIPRSCPDLSSHPPVTILQVHHNSSLSVYLYSVEWVETRVVWVTLNLWMWSMVLVINVPMDRVSFDSTSVVMLEGKLVDICYLLNMILTGIVLPVVSYLEWCLFPTFPLVWSELEAQALLVRKGSFSQLMLSSAVYAVSVVLWITLGTIIQEAYEVVVMLYHFGWLFIALLYAPLVEFKLF
ncbi:Uncharacterized protein Rs2_31749 [Raphanus sativus]|nr:Uncharacterized protein Rs2_31749 [Raphanus sativus]